MGRRLAFDLEVAKAIPPKGVITEDLPADIEYCAGWTDFAGMGLACLCFVDVDTGERLPWAGEDNPVLAGFIIAQAALLVSFNGLSFDARVLSALDSPLIVPAAKHYDILDEIYRATRRRFKLDDLARVNLGRSKTEDGANAPILWQRGERERVIEYCFNDCEITAEIFKLIETRGFLLNPYDGGEIRLQYRAPEVMLI